MYTEIQGYQPNSNYNAFWMYPLNVNSPPQAEIQVDSLTIIECDPCGIDSLCLSSWDTCVTTGMGVPVTQGYIDLTVGCGVGPYTYVWTLDGNFYASTEDLGNLLQDGTYCVTVTDANGCDTNTTETTKDKQGSTD